MKEHPIDKIMKDTMKSLDSSEKQMQQIYNEASSKKDAESQQRRDMAADNLKQLQEIRKNF